MLVSGITDYRDAAFQEKLHILHLPCRKLFGFSPVDISNADAGKDGATLSASYGKLVFKDCLVILPRLFFIMMMGNPLIVRRIQKIGTL